MQKKTTWKISCFIPKTHLEKVKQAMFASGAGKQGNYECCSWQTLGTGQFKPLARSQPFIGSLDTIHSVEEYKVEMLCDENKIYAVIDALKKSHPYEEPAFNAYKVTVFICSEDKHPIE